MRIGFHYHIPMLQKQDGSVWVPGYLGVFLDGLAGECDELICFMHSPLNTEVRLMDYQLKNENITLVDIGPHISMMKRVLKAKHYAEPIAPYLYNIDIMLIRGPSPLLPKIASMCRKKDIPVSYLLVGNYLEGLNAAVTMNKLKKSILWMYYTYNKRMQDKNTEKTLVFVNSSKLFDEYKLKIKKCIEVRTTTLTKEDFFERLDTCQDSTIELLYTGRIDPTKGIEDIFYAVSMLNKQTKKNIRINLVGWETSTGFLDKLQKLAQKLEIEKNYTFHGKKTVGKELFEMYKKSDIYVLASRGDFEGFPRTLWEAMANSTPIIATKVGAIPFILEDKENALLAEPNNQNEYAKAIEHLIESEDLRKKIIKNGYSLAGSNTIEMQSKKMVNIMKRYLDNV